MPHFGFCCPWLMLFLSLISCLFIPLPVQAQSNEPPPALTVMLRDMSDQGIANITVHVTDRTGSREFARVVTDVNGQAVIALLPTGDVRVRVEGIWNGIALSQSGADTEGILLLGGDPPLTLDLRIASDGQVLPDPATMIAPDFDGPNVPIPTARFPATTSVGVSPLPEQKEITTRILSAGADAAGTTTSVTAQADGAHSVASEQPDGTTFALIGVCILAGFALLIAVFRWGRPA